MKKIKKRKFSETEDQVIHQMPLSKKKRKICISQKLSQSEHENKSKDQTRIAINISDKELDREPMRTDEADLPVDVPTEGSLQSVSERKKKNKKKRRKSKEESKVKDWPDASNVMEIQTMEKDCEKLKTKSRPGFVQNNFCIEPKGSEGDCQIKSYKERPETKKKKREKSTENQTEVASGLELGGQITDEKFKKKKKKKKKLTVESNEKVSHVQTKKSEGTEDSEFVEGIALELGLDRDKKLNSKRENEVESQERHKKHTSKTKQKSKLNWTGDTNLMEKQTIEKEKHKMKRKLKVLIVQDDFCNDTEAKK